MLIIHADRSAITNFRNAKYIGLSGRHIHAQMIDGMNTQLAVYGNDDRAKEVFLEIVNTISQRKVGLVIMPEE